MTPRLASARGPGETKIHCSPVSMTAWHLSCRWPKGYYRAAQSLVAMRRWPEAAAILQIAAKQCGRHSEVQSSSRQGLAVATSAP